MIDDLLLSDAELAELSEDELADYATVLTAELEELRRRSRWLPSGASLAGAKAAETLRSEGSTAASS